MRAINIRVNIVGDRLTYLKASFSQNWVHYLQEALGLALFMVSACFFSGMLESNKSLLHATIPDLSSRRIIMGLMMGPTALFIFYSPLTAPSGSHINPAVTITFFRLGKIGLWDTLLYILFQLAGGTVAVFFMAFCMGEILTAAPVHYAVTVPGPRGPLTAAIAELIMAFCMFTMVLFTSADERLKKYTRIISACFVCLYVILASPISGFGMNPARTIASALPAHIYTAFWIYMIMPVAGMLTAAEGFLLIRKRFRLNDIQEL